MFKLIFEMFTATVIGLGLAMLVVIALVVLRQSVHAQGVPCWEVPNGVNRTLRCANGYWHTTTPEGEVYTGNGQTDPSATAMGSGIIINPGTGGPFIGAGQTVTAPTQVLPMLEPFQANQYGFMPRQD